MARATVERSFFITNSNGESIIVKELIDKADGRVVVLEEVDGPGIVILDSETLGPVLNSLKKLAGDGSAE